MNFQKDISISETEIIQEINDTYSNEKRMKLIMQLLPDVESENLDLDFLLKIMKAISTKVSGEVIGSGFESEAKDVKNKINNLYNQLEELGWI
jgi:3-dehydroquinate dehydratase